MGLFSTLGSTAGTVLGGGSHIGGAIGNAVGSFVDGEMQQSRAENFSSAQAAATRQWQTDMSGTTYQRTMADMKAAGLNPMMALLLLVSVKLVPVLLMAVLLCWVPMSVLLMPVPHLGVLIKPLAL